MDTALNPLAKTMLIGLVSGAMMIGGCKPKVVQQTVTGMDTTGELVLPAKEKGKLPAAVKMFNDILVELGPRFDTSNPESEISKFNAAAGQPPIEISPFLNHVLDSAKRYSELSGGAFDITTGPLLEFWGLSGGKTPSALPSKDQLAPILKKVGNAHLIMTSKTAGLDVEGARIDVELLARAMAVDMACRDLLESGYSNFLISLDTTCRSQGVSQKRRNWLLEMKDPFDPEQEQVLGTFIMANGFALAMEGDRAHRITVDGKKYARVVDPRSGLPVSGLAKVVVLSDTAIVAEVVARALFVIGMKDSKQYISRLGATEVMFIPDKQPIEIWITAGFSKYFKPKKKYAKKMQVIK